ncbi:hypothetical protein PoB_004298100 [Plakobranchus ocellatus]|uniref:Uncharacterized protein n=1 Tax=Plakobranchus ocellatus TaxID=259542 RepID=A0AAV4B7Q5_9GAST|nr:hypothetical protein PoB_004298100 [Plakobranchus ocellatus]
MLSAPQPAGMLEQSGYHSRKEFAYSVPKEKVLHKAQRRVKNNSSRNNNNSNSITTTTTTTNDDSGADQFIHKLVLYRECGLQVVELSVQTVEYK